MCVTECCYKCVFFFSRYGLIFTTNKEQFLFSINIFKSNQNNKKRSGEQSTPISMLHLKATLHALYVYESK